MDIVEAIERSDSRNDLETMGYRVVSTSRTTIRMRSSCLG